MDVPTCAACQQPMTPHCERVCGWWKCKGCKVVLDRVSGRRVVGA